MKEPMGFIKDTKEKGGLKTDMVFERTNDAHSNSEDMMTVEVIPKKNNKKRSSSGEESVYEAKYKAMKKSKQNWETAFYIAVIILIIVLVRVYNSGFIYEVFGMPPVTLG